MNLLVRDSLRTWGVVSGFHSVVKQNSSSRLWKIVENVSPLDLGIVLSFKSLSQFLYQYGHVLVQTPLSFPVFVRIDGSTK
jgi:hypothetical protein